MEKTNGHHVPKIVVTDYDAEKSSQQNEKQETSGNKSNDANDSSQSSSPNAPVANESEEEDREIIESLKNAHPTNCERHVDVDADGNAAPSVSNVEESRKENVTPDAMTESDESDKVRQILPTNFDTDDEMADMEVSQLTSLLESKKKCVSVPGSILQRPTASFAAVPPPPGTLPDVSNVGLPRLVPKKKEPDSDDSMDHLFGCFQPLGEMSFSAERSESSSGSECIPAKNSGAGKLKNRRTVRLHGESETDSQCSSSSSSDDHPPMYWKLYNNSPEPSEDGSKEDIEEILSSFHVVENATVDENAPSTSKDAQKANTLPKQSGD